MKTDIRNLITTARGTPVSEGDSESHTYGFINLQFWIPSKQSWFPTSEDKFQVTAPTYEEAKQIFWDRFHSYCQRRFNLPYIKIERL